MKVYEYISNRNNLYVVCKLLELFICSDAEVSDSNVFYGDRSECAIRQYID